VSAPEIDKFKGAMNGFNAEYGIFITTTSFTEAAQKKSVQGGNTVTLISGQDIAELVERYQLHITPVNTYRLF
jgi:restriction system protein